jgi:very-short-patch-repair endonuclease
MKSIFENILSKNERRYLKHVGIGKILRPSQIRYTGLERKYYMMLKSLGVFFVPQYPLEGRYYDAYLPDHNILFEFDGSFWHPKTEKEAIYGFQKKAIKVDKLKNEIAKKEGMKIIRIREESPITVEEMKKLIWD